MRNVFLAFPAYRGEVATETLHTAMRLEIEILRRGWGCFLEDRVGSGEIHAVRNYFVAKMLDGDFTDLFFIDDDVGTEDYEAVIQMLEAPVDLVGGVYPTRTEEQRWMVRYLRDRPELYADPDTGLLEVEAIPAGFLRLSRDCLQQMVYHYEGLKYADANAPGGVAWGLFYPELKDGQSFSEDFNFCLRWRAIGGKVWVAPNINFKHVGRKAFAGNFGNWLKSRPVEGKAA